MILAPCDFGLPAKFSSFRENQLDAIFEVTGARKRFTILRSPTGSGKTVIAMTAARWLAQQSKKSDFRTLYVTSTKGLMDQVEQDKFSGLISLRGASNYRCHEASTCAEGMDIECRSRNIKSLDCPHLIQRNQAKVSGLVSSNYDVMMSSNSLGDNFLGEFDFVIFDEAHDILDKATEYSSIVLSKSSLKSLGLVSPPANANLESLVSWSSDNLDYAQDSLKSFRRTVGFTRLSKQVKDLSRLSKIDVEEEENRTYPRYIISNNHGDSGTKLTDIWPGRNLHWLAYRETPRILLMSATINSRSHRFLGISEDDFDWIGIESTFDLKRRPFYFLPTMPVDFRLTDGQLKKLMQRVDKYIEARLGHRIIIHCRSYSWMNRISKASKWANYIITHKNGESRFAVDRFIKTKPPVILVSPDVHTGYSFDHDKCRYQIYWKVPTNDSRDPIIKARTKSSPLFKTLTEAEEFEQTYGRNMRADDDWGETICFDSHATKWFLDKIRNVVPNDFKKSWRIINDLPTPLHQKLGV